MTKAYSYTRFSTPEQARGDSLRRQTELATDYATAHGLDLDTELTFQDLGKSAFRGSNIETGRLADFLEAVKAGLVPPGSFLLVESLDRISRQNARKALRALEDICEAGVSVVTLTDNRVYTAATLDNDPMALVMCILIFIRANEESAIKASRLRASWSHKRQIAADKPMTSRGPSWLRLANGKWEIIEARAEVVRRIFALTAEGVGQNAITALLNREGVPVFAGGQHWHRAFIASLLHNPAVIGTLVPHTMDYSSGKRQRQPQAPIENYYPPVVDLGLYAAVTAMLATKAPLRGRHANDGRIRNVLGGLATCPACGSSMVTVNKGPRARRKLVCSKAKAGAGCPYHSVPYEPLERALVRQADRLIGEAPRNGEALARADELESEMWAKQDELERLIDAVASGQLTNTPALATRIRQAEAELASLRRELTTAQAAAAATRGPLVAQRLAELHTALRAQPLDRQRANALFRQLLAKVTIDWPEWTLVFDWRHGGESELIFGMDPVLPAEIEEVQNARGQA